MKPLPLLLALLLTWLAVASGHHFVEQHAWASNTVPGLAITCFLSPGLPFGTTLFFLTVPALFLLIGLALWGRWQRRRGSARPAMRTNRPIPRMSGWPGERWLQACGVVLTRRRRR